MKPVGLMAIEAEMARQGADALASFRAAGPVAARVAGSLRRTGRLDNIEKGLWRCYRLAEGRYCLARSRAGRVWPSKAQPESATTDEADMAKTIPSPTLAETALGLRTENPVARLMAGFTGFAVALTLILATVLPVEAHRAFHRRFRARAQALRQAPHPETEKRQQQGRDRRQLPVAQDHHRDHRRGHHQVAA